MESLDRQMEPGIEHLDAKPNNLERYNYFIGESDRNETTIANRLRSQGVPALYVRFGRHGPAAKVITLPKQKPQRSVAI